jgi:asparagine synthase (glutamine-hydrolysing)
MLSFADLDLDRRLVSYLWWSPEALRRTLYSADFAAATASMDPAGPLLGTLGRFPQERDPLQRSLILDTKHFLADHNLNYTDKMGMAAGVEVRVPLVDLDLVRLAARIPSHLKYQGTTGKAIFKRAMAGALPHEVIYRPKTGFGAPLRRWLREDLRDRVADTLSPSSVRHRGFFDHAAVWHLVEQDRAGRVDGGYTIFALMCFELWCRQFVDRTAPATVQAAG